MAIEFASPFALIYHFCRAAQDGYPTKEMILVLDLKLSRQDLLRVNRDEVERGVKLAGAMEGRDPSFGKPIYPIYRMDIESNISLARQKLDESAISFLMAEDRAITVDEAIATVLES